MYLAIKRKPPKPGESPKKNIDGSKPCGFLHYRAFNFDLVQEDFIHLLKKGNLKKSVEILCEILTFSIGENNLDLFIETIIFIGQLYFDYNDVQNALFAMKEALTVIHYTKQLTWKSDVYLICANCCIFKKKYDNALKFLYKAL